MKRRDFLTISSGLTASALLKPHLWAADLPKDIRITRILAFDLPTQRMKLVGKNSRRDIHGDTSRDRMVRLFTNSGLEGLGNCRASEKELTPLLGSNPFDYFKADKPAMDSPLGTGSMPLWDLAGKALGKPAYALLGGQGARPVPVYDGSIYFMDLLQQYADRWQDRLKEEIDMGLARGHRAFKIKIGRGAKWMPTEEGYARDKAVLKIIRKHAGPDVLMGVDANNGYDLARTKRLLGDLPDIKLAFIEEMFPEEVDQYLDLKEFIKKHKLQTLIADGESQREPKPFLPFMEAQAIDIYQGDMNRFGFEGILTEAAMAKPHGFTVAPHNWGSLVGYYMQVHVGGAISNFYRAENDPLESETLIAEGYKIKDGSSTVPDAPGFGLKLDKKKFAATIKPKYDLKM